MLATWGYWHNVGYSNISVGLGHSICVIDASKLTRGVSSIIICQEVPMVSVIASHHSCSVLIGDGSLGSSHPLFFIVDSSAVLVIRIVSIMALFLLCLVSDEYNIRLIYSSLV